jgi:hypothetical protein
MLLDQIRDYMGLDWYTLGDICAAFPAESEVEIYALLIDDDYFQRYGSHYQVRP